MILYGDPSVEVGEWDTKKVRSLFILFFFHNDFPVFSNFHQKKDQNREFLNYGVPDVCKYCIMHTIQSRIKNGAYLIYIIPPKNAFEKQFKANFDPECRNMFLHICPYLSIFVHIYLNI